MPDFLSDRVNHEYINADRLINKEVINRQFAHIQSFKEEYLKPNVVDSSMKYSFDKLFEDFRNSVEGILSADYEDNLTLTKSYELIKKYNNLSSFLNNVIKLGTITERDVVVIKEQFTSIMPLLNELRNVADSYNFLDRGEISDMVSKIENGNYSPVSADVRGVSIQSKLTEKNDLVSIVEKANRIIEDLESKPNLSNDEIQQLDDLTIFFTDEKDDIRKAFRSGKDSNPEQYIQYIKSNFDRLNQLQQAVKSQENYVDDRFDVLLRNENIASNDYKILKQNTTGITVKKISGLVDSIIQQYKDTDMNDNDIPSKLMSADQLIVSDAEDDRDLINDKWDQESIAYKDRLKNDLDVLLPKIEKELDEYKNNVMDNNLDDIDELRKYDDDGLDILVNNSGLYITEFQKLRQELYDAIHQFDITPAKRRTVTVPVKAPVKPTVQVLQPVQQLSSKDTYHAFVKDYRNKNGNMSYKKAQADIKRLKLWNK